MPGGVGLGVLDSFALELPLITTSVPCQGPEVDYLHDGVNGMVVQDAGSGREYADSIASLLHDSRALERLRIGCRESADSYSIENMAGKLPRESEQPLWLQVAASEDSRDTRAPCRRSPPLAIPPRYERDPWKGSTSVGEVRRLVGGAMLLMGILAHRGIRKIVNAGPKLNSSRRLKTEHSQRSSPSESTSLPLPLRR